jgi:hypothetical protein
VGYRDTTALRRLMQKTINTTPGRVRAAAGVAVAQAHRAKAARKRAVAS